MRGSSFEQEAPATWSCDPVREAEQPITLLFPSVAPPTKHYLQRSLEARQRQASTLQTGLDILTRLADAEDRRNRALAASKERTTRLSGS